MKGAIVGSYRVLDTLSVGGMGTVYRAEHTLIGRLAAVKILHPELCANRDIVNRFFNEAKATTSIKHPGIVEVFDFGYMPSGHAYLIMELLEGMPLSRRMRTRGAIPEGEAALVLRSVCIALSAAHDKGVVHRDLKPDNIFVIPDPDSVLGERTKILDFGIAKLTDIGLAGSGTRTGAVMGTPTYMSPEQCSGTGEVDTRADLYSIGCVFYELVAGRPPFVNTGAGEVIGSHLFVDPAPPSRHVAGLSPVTEALIMKLLAKQPEHRVQSAKELAHLLTGIAQQHGWPALGDVSRPSLSHVAVAPPARPGGQVAPAMTPTTLLATTVTPDHAETTTTLTASPLSTVQDATAKPTTLSGAASQVDHPPRRSRRRLGIAIAAGLLAAAGGIAAILAFGEPSAHRATRSTAAAQPAAAVHEAAPTTAPAAPATEPTEPATLVQATAAPAEPAMPTPTPSDPMPPAQPGAPSASATSPAIPLPAAKPAVKPTKKPVRKPDKAGSASDHKDLLEQDI